MLVPLVCTIGAFICVLIFLTIFPWTRLEVVSAISDDLRGYVHWVVLKSLVLFLSISNVVVTVYYSRRLRVQRNQLLQKSKDIYASTFLEMRRAQLKYLSISYVLIAMANMAIMGI